MECRIVLMGCDGLFTTAFRYEDGIAIDIGDDVCMVEEDGSWTTGKCMGFVIDEDGPAINVDGDIWRLGYLEETKTSVVKPVRDACGNVLHLGQEVSFAGETFEIDRIDQIAGDVRLKGSEALYTPSKFVKSV